MIHRTFALISLFLVLCATPRALYGQQLETKGQHDARMKWWREARFGLFIHWGLYSIPAGEWGGKTTYGEWIRNEAQIPVPEYDKLVAQFNPVDFDADTWVRTAKEAGMNYIVITSKHHDGFALFDAKVSDFDVMATPFHRDILKELSIAARKYGMKLCFYYSIMDWHHPDYLPRRGWELKDRPATGADFDRYLQYMKAELKELLTNYGPIGVLWFDGEWENTWNPKYGRDLYDYVRSLQPDIIINNRVGAGRTGMEGFTAGGEFAGDFGTPEQQIPATGLPGVDWETCMTMNDHWGYNSHDEHWKSSKALIQMLADIASKGGNFLLNVGPTSRGTFPQASLDRLHDMGAWMKVNGESIYDTQASPFKTLAWGRSTQTSIPGGSRLYLHVFDWPSDGQLAVHGIYNRATGAYLLSDAQKRPLTVTRVQDALAISVPKEAPDPNDSVVVLDLVGKPDVNDPPTIASEFSIFVNGLEVQVKSNRENVEVHYTLDGSEPSATSPLAESPLRLTETTVVSARCFRAGKAVSDTAQMKFTKVVPRPAVDRKALENGVQYAYYEGPWLRLPDFAALTPVKKGVLANFEFSPRNQAEHIAFEYTGFIRVPETGVYVFSTNSDDGSRLYIGDELVVDNDGEHGMQERQGVIALAAGLHPIRVTYFNAAGGDGLKVEYKGPNFEKQPVPPQMLFYAKP